MPKILKSIALITLTSLCTLPLNPALAQSRPPTDRPAATPAPGLDIALQSAQAAIAACKGYKVSTAVVDSSGNLIVAVGPDKDSVAFVAHTDEVSFEVDSILPDGHVTLTKKGGVIPSAWEGQPAMLVFDPDATGNTNEALRGVFVPRETARGKAPPRLLL